LAQLSFSTHSAFYRDLRQRVDRYFEESGISPKGDGRLHLKTAIICAVVVVSYVWAVFLAQSLWSAAVACFVLAQGISLVGANIMHDGAHGAYSESPRVNWWMGFTLDLLGGSNKMWRISHNISHHMFTNIEGYDVDLFTNGLLRLSPVQERKPFHRFQPYYLFIVYSGVSLWWVTTRDIEYFFFKKGARNSATLTRSQVGLLILTKIVYFAIALVLPMTLHSPAAVTLAFLFTHVVAGITLTTVFQLAHTTENVAFPEPEATSQRMGSEWAVHQVETTADFAPNSRLAAWYLGGLNFQIEHHLFSHVSHVHYPAISRIVRQACAEHGVRYQCYPSFRAALKAHLDFVARMGRPSSLTTAPALPLRAP
jgi:linoleoyl-CoA desaturase